MLLMPKASYAASDRLHRIYKEISGIPSIYHPSVSYGIMEAGNTTELSASQILRRADQEMYRDKQAKQSDRK